MSKNRPAERELGVLFTLGLILGVVHSTGLYKYTITCIYLYSIIQRIFTALEILCAPPLTPGNHWSFNRLHSFAFSSMFIVGIIQYDWLLSLSIMHLNFLHVFSWLESSFFLALNNIPLSGYTTFWSTSWLLSSFDSHK